MNTTSNLSSAYIGGYTRNHEPGIYLCQVEPSTGALTLRPAVAQAANPSFLVVHSSRQYLYAVNETMTFQDQPGGAVSAFAINEQDGSLNLLNQQPSFGGAPCHIVMDRSERFVLVANYMGGNLAVYPIRPDGSLDAASDMVQHHGRGADPRRQERPHAHSITIAPDNRFALAADLGLDRIMIYRLDLESGKLIAHDPPYTALHPGAGPRHLAFHPNGHLVYAVNELDSTLTVFAYDPGQGTMREIQTLSTLPADWQGSGTSNSGADVHVHPSGRFVYSSNRGHDSIAVFAVDQTTGQLTAAGHTSTQGRTPRNFAVHPDGALLLAANQDSHTVVAFHIHPETGQLAPTSHAANVPMPVCMTWMPGD